jgi:tripartite-type tricarboxylate transporter receptor subunit TctC
MTTGISRRACVAATALLLAGAAAAQTYPSKPIRLIVPYAPASAPDLLSRLVAQKMTESLGQPVVVDNRAGAAGQIGADAISKAAPDGYTIGLLDGNTYAILPAANPQIAFDPLRDFALIMNAVRLTLFLAVNPAVEAKNVQEFIALAKARPGLNYGSAGQLGVHHLAMENFMQMAGIKMTHIPYKGVVQTVPALMTGEVVAMFNSLPSLSPHLKSGKLRLLGAGSPQRSPLLPELPTVSESGLRGFEALYSMGFAAPAGTPKEIIDQLHTHMARALQQPDVKEKLAGVGLELVLSSPAEFREQIQREQIHYKKLVNSTNLKN